MFTGVDKFSIGFHNAYRTPINAFRKPINTYRNPDARRPWRPAPAGCAGICVHRVSIGVRRFSIGVHKVSIGVDTGLMRRLR